MNQPHPNSLRAGVAAVALCIALDAAAAARVDPDSTVPQSIPQLQQALATERATYGLFDLRQQDTLKTLVTNLTALGRVQEAQDLMVYWVRIAEKNYGEGDPRVVPAFCDLGNWFAEVGKDLEARSTFQVALNIAATKRAANDLIAVDALRGIVRTEMLRQSYPDSALRPRFTPDLLHDSSGRAIVASRKANRSAERALKQALLILETDPRAPVQERIETLLQAGDWYQIKKSPGEALPYYQKAWQLIGAEQTPPSSVASAFSSPVRVYYLQPQIVASSATQLSESTEPHYVQVEFTVAADGSVTDARVVDHDTLDRYVDDILDAVRAARYRPQFVDGQPVATTGMTYREVFRTARSQT